MKYGVLVFSLAAALLLAGLPGPAGAQGEAAAPDWLAGEVSVQFGNLTHASIAGIFAAHKVTLMGSTRTAQDIRGTYDGLQRAGGGEAFVQGLEAALRTRLEGALASLFPQAQVDVRSTEIARDTLVAPRGPDPHQPPVRFGFNASVAYSLASLGLSSGALAFDDAKARAVLEIGASAQVPYNLTAQPGWNITFRFALPAWVRIAAAEGGSLSPDGGMASWELANWRGASPQMLPVTVTLRARDAPADTPTDAHVILAVDMNDVVGLSIPGLLAGDFGELQVSFDARVTARSLRLRDFPVLEAQLRQRLPPRLSLEGVNADGLRLAAREGLLPPDALGELEAYFRAIAAQRISALGPQKAELAGGFQEGALASRDISNPLDGDPPLVYRVGATFRIPLAAAQASRLQAATGMPLVQRELTFDLPRVRGIDTTYRLTLPSGIALVDVEAKGARTDRGTEAGRDFVVVTPEGDDARATFTVAVTTDFVLAKFWYVWLGLLLFAILVVAFLVARRVRRRAKPAEAVPEEAPEPGAREAPPPPAPPPGSA